jgi:uncharacterized membrane protein (DUF485 family)
MAPPGGKGKVVVRLREEASMVSEPDAKTFDRETLLDLVVNAIPLGIILFFILVFALVNPFGSNPVNTAIQFSIMIVTGLALLVLTYVSGKAVSEAEDELEEQGLELSEEAGADRTAETTAPAETEDDAA